MLNFKCPRQLIQYNQPDFTILSYNILSQSNIRNHHYPLHSSEDLDQNKRQQFIKNDLISLNADIACLQEFDIYGHKTFQNTFEQLNYSYCFQKKELDKNFDGILTAYKNDKFSLIKKYHFFGLFKKDQNFNEILLNEMTRDFIILFTILEDKKSKKQICVVNLHLTFETQRGLMKFASCILILKCLKKIQQIHNLSHFFIAGDYNMIPYSGIYKYMTSGELNLETKIKQMSNYSYAINFKGDFKQRFFELNKKFEFQQDDSEPINKEFLNLILNIDIDLTNEKIKFLPKNNQKFDLQKELKMLWENFELKSSSKEINKDLKNNEQEYGNTHIIQQLSATVDFIFYTKNTIQPVSYLQPLKLEQIQQIIKEKTLPIKTYGSDHFPIFFGYKYINQLIQQKQKNLTMLQFLLIIQIHLSLIMQSLINIPENSDFTIHNFPLGVFHLKTQNLEQSKCCTILGDTIINLAQLHDDKLIELSSKNPFSQNSLNEFISLGKENWISLRKQLQNLFTPLVSKNEQCEKPNFDTNLLTKSLHNINDVNLLLPCKVGDYTDFYSSYNHAFNVGSMFRGPDNALQPNWLWLPVGYHGRSSSVVVSPHSFPRPQGQKKNPDPKGTPFFGKSAKMDFELEMVTVIGKNNKLGEPVSINNAWDHIFGYCLMNDVSARDIQAWEYVPLGPFTAKNLVTVISPWIVTQEALEHFRLKLEPQNPEPLEYLRDKNHSSFDINLQVFLKSEKMENDQKISESNFKYLYWNPAQQLTHHTVTGCNLQVGDFLGSGTISGKEKSEYGSFLELSWNGKEEIEFSNGEKRKFWEDGDEVILRGYGEKNGVRIGFGECRSKLLPQQIIIYL